MKKTLFKVFLVTLSLLLFCSGISFAAVESDGTEQGGELGTGAGPSFEEVKQVVEFKTITVTPETLNSLIKQDSKVIISGKGFRNGGTVTSLGIIPADTDTTDIGVISKNLKIIYSSHFEKEGPNIQKNGEFVIKTSITASYGAPITPGIYKVFLWWIPAENVDTDLPYPIEDVAISTGTFVVSDKSAEEPPVVNSIPKATPAVTPDLTSSPIKATPVPANAPISVTIDGSVVDFDVPPQIVEGRTLVPLRKIFEALNANVVWEASTKTITGTKGETRVVLKVGSTQATINGVIKVLDVAPTVIDGRTLVPARFISESLGADVKWDQKNKTVIITN
ncbi:MAG: copper amine oxidase N-terminal domain-containing protein [Clostridia bacterium]|nr:copper amine oxidase N-terminal domain-containing protein [Clostridia bacterium]